jgi:NAD(P)-dependent dehydrogenase (short-subunit alcohol dehydrogenase family)
MRLSEILSNRIVLLLFVGLASVSIELKPQPAQGQPVDAPTVLITGSNRGIGLAFAEAYAERGWNVIATCRTPVKAHKLKELAEKYKHVLIEEMDVSDFSEIDALALKYENRSIDLLLNNAGILVGIEQIRLGNIDYDLLENMFNVNSIGPLKVSEAFLDNVASSNQKKIVTMTTIGASIGSVTRQGAYQYRASKAAVNMIMRIMSFEVADRGVIIGLVHPGMVDTRGFLDADPETLPDRVREALPRIRETFLRPDESVDLMISLIDGLTPEKSGVFYDVHGEILPW